VALDDEKARGAPAPRVGIGSAFCRFVLNEQGRQLLELSVEAGRIASFRAQRKHVLAGLCRIFAARAGGWIELHDGRCQPTSALDWGLHETGERAALWWPFLDGGTLA
jgi:hypothetical protein